MAATPGAQCAPLTPLESIALTVADLPEIAGEWAQICVDERLSWSLDWGNEMSRLDDLARAAADGTLSPAACEKYRALLRDVEAALPTVDRLGPRRPSVQKSPLCTRRSPDSCILVP